MNLIMINFPFDVFPFIKKINKIQSLIKCLLKSISRKMIIDLCFFITKKDINRFKNNVLFILIRHLILKQSNSKRAFLKKLKSSIR